MDVAAVSPQDNAFEPMAALEINATLLKSEWSLCDRVAEYLSSIAGQSHSDAARYANFVSVTVNELIELAYRTSPDSGAVKFEVHQNDEHVRVDMSFSCVDALREAMIHTIRRGVRQKEPHLPVGHVMDDVSRVVELAEICRVGLSARTELSDRIVISAAFRRTEELQ
ncbi:hypothetical protein [Agrobacterium tumefaciens]|uniref:hypothetical protein n=1 Tax=Agrobacterium tumefaciens TaxID=358 RepID=UPI0021CECB29|nr:hypothetical protein [Agrobacterium tumefaciens]UXS03989.1 hypothetical protein FY156_20960 [Agrobacterium tumefaciens]